MRQNPLFQWATLPLMLASTMLAGGRAIADSDVTGILAANQAATGATPPGETVLRATYAFTGEGLNGRYVEIDDFGAGRFNHAFTAGPLTQVQGFDGRHAWQKDPSGVVTQQDGGDQRQSAVSEAYREGNLWWQDDRGGAEIKFSGEREENGARYDVLLTTPLGGKPFEAWFDRKSHLLNRTVQKQGAQTVTNSFSDYRRIGGMMQAGILAIDDGAGADHVDIIKLIDAQYLGGADATAFSAPKTQVTDSSITGSRTTSLPFRLVDNRIYADVMIDGKGPFLFIFDTGATDSMSSSLAKELVIAAKGDLETHGAGEGVGGYGLTRVAEMGIADARLHDQIFEVSDDGLGNVEGLDDRGIVGTELFQRFVVTIDYPNHRLTLIDPKNFNAKTAGVPIHFDFEGNVIEIMAEFDGLPARLVVDTGSRGDIVLNKPFVERNRLQAKHPFGVTAIGGWGLGGPMRVYATRGASLKLGPVHVGNVVAQFTTGNKGALTGSDFDGAIGGGVLKRSVVTFDYPHQTVYLKPAADALEDVGTFDRAGLWFNASSSGFEIVDVIPNGPAAKAGLAGGDQIVEVDGRSAKSITVYDLRRRLRNDSPGTLVTFTVRRGGRVHLVSLTLRDLI